MRRTMKGETRERIASEGASDRASLGGSDSTPLRCVTCRDEAVLATVLALREAHQALVEDCSGQRALVAIDFTPEARVGDILLVHSGVAIARLGEERS